MSLERVKQFHSFVLLTWMGATFEGEALSMLHDLAAEYATEFPHTGTGKFASALAAA